VYVHDALRIALQSILVVVLQAHVTCRPQIQASTDGEPRSSILGVLLTRSSGGINYSVHDLHGEVQGCSLVCKLSGPILHGQDASDEIHQRAT
jgi:hypothetical protein